MPPVNSFWPTFLFTAIAGSVAISYGTPYLKRYIPGVGDESKTYLIIEEQAGQTKQAEPSNAQRETNDKVRLDPELVPGKTENNIKNVEQQVIVTQPAKPVVTSDPNAVGVRTGKWGVTLSYVAHYSLQGNNLGKLPGGTIVEIEGNTTSSRGKMTRCRYRQNGSWSESILIAEAQLAHFNGTSADMQPTALSTLQNYFAAKSAIEKYTASAETRQVEANPYSKPYREAYEKYKDLTERSKVLTAERDNAEGARRSQLIDQLRRMKEEQAALQRDITSYQAKYREWKARHASEFSSNAANDPKVKALQQKMAALEPDVRRLVPNL